MFIGASEEEKSLEISIALEGFTVQNLMTPSVDSVPPSMTLNDFSEYMVSHKHLGYPVMEKNKVLGIMTINELHKVEKEKQNNTSVNDAMRKDVISISPNETAISAFKIMMKNNHERLLVQKEGQYIGIISWSDLLRAMKMKGVVRNESGTH